MIYSNHSIIRKAQRGIKNEHVSLLFENGSTEIAPGGVKKVMLKRKDVQAAISRRKKDIQLLSKLSGLTAIVAQDEVITFYKAH